LAVGPPTCPAEGVGCGEDEWEGEFFPGIPKIKYEVMYCLSKCELMESQEVLTY